MKAGMRVKAILLSAFLLATAGACLAQECEPEWLKYTTGGYLYALQSAKNEKSLSETVFRDGLANEARAQLARQIRVEVKDVSEISKSAVNGRSSTKYASNTSFSTDVEMKLVEVRTAYDRASHSGSAIAFINKATARDYYANELMLLYNRLESYLAQADNYVASGSKAKAREVLKKAEGETGDYSDALVWLNLFGEPQAQLEQWQSKFSDVGNRIKSVALKLEHGTVIYLQCRADLFGEDYGRTFANELKGVLAHDGCSFTNNPDQADFIVKIVASAREHTNVVVGARNSYFSYVDAEVSIDNVVTGQCVYVDQISCKGGHTLGYAEAAKAGYKDIKNQIGNSLRKNISQ